MMDNLDRQPIIRETRNTQSLLHRLLHHRAWGGLRIDYGIVTWRCCGDIYGYVPDFRDYPGERMDLEQ